MSGGTHSQGAFAKLIIEPGVAPHTFDVNSLAIEILQESMSDHGRHGGNEGIRGTLAHESARIRKLPGYVFGSVAMYVSPNAIANLGSNVLGLAESPAGTFTMDDDLPYFGMLIDTDYNTFEFKDCMIDSWILRSRAPEFGEEGEPDMLFLQMNIFASEVVKGTAWPGSPPSLGTAASDAAYVFADGVVTLNSSAREVEEFVLAVYNKCKVKYVNSLVAQSIRPTDRQIRCRVKLPWNSDNNDLYGQAVAGAACSFVFTNGAFSATINGGKFQVPDNTPVVPGKKQISLIVDGEIRASGATADLVIINDNTP